MVSPKKSAIFQRLSMLGSFFPLSQLHIVLWLMPNSFARAYCEIPSTFINSLILSATVILIILLTLYALGYIICSIYALGQVYIFWRTHMKKLLILLLCIVIFSLVIFTACDNISKKEQEKFDQIALCLDAGDYEKALDLCNDLSKRELKKGKSTILDAVKKQADNYLQTLSDWMCNDHDGVIDTTVVKKFRLLSAILDVIGFDSTIDISNVKSFIDSVIALEPYAKWNDFSNNNGYTYSTTAFEYLSKALKSTSLSTFEYYLELSVSDFKSAYYECDRYSSSYGCGIAAKYYKSYADYLQSVLDDTNKARNESYDTSFEKIREEWSDVVDMLNRYVDTLPDKIY